MMKPYLSVTLICLLLSFFLLGCGEEHQLRELKNYVIQLKQKVTTTPPRKETASEFELPAPVKYGSNSAAEIGSMQSKEATNPLQAYPLKTLQLVGTVTQNQKTWAYLMTPDTMVYQAKEGDIIGDSYGKIIKIYSGHIEVLQKNAVPGLGQQVITLQLKE